MRGFRLQLVLAALSVAAPIQSVQAEDSEWSGSIAAGIGVRPDYPGSRDLEPTPYIAGELAYGRYFLELQGKEVALGIELTPSLSLGPLLDIENGRDDGVKSDRVGRLPEIDDAVQAGGFARYAWGGLFGGHDELTLEATYLRDVSDTYDGGVGSLGLFYGRRLGDRWSLGGGVRLTHVDGNYARTYFGITPAAATASGLSTYDPGGGLRDIGVSAKLAYALDENWNIQLLGNYKQLLGDFKDSPVVKQEGRAGQFSGAVAVGYRF